MAQKKDLSARVGTLERANEDLAKARRERDKAQRALAAARRELQEGREIVARYHKHITGSAKPDPDCDECSEIREWLAAPATDQKR